MVFARRCEYHQLPRLLAKVIRVLHRLAPEARMRQARVAFDLRLRERGSRYDRKGWRARPEAQWRSGGRDQPLVPQHSWEAANRLRLRGHARVPRRNGPRTEPGTLPQPSPPLCSDGSHFAPASIRRSSPTAPLARVSSSASRRRRTSTSSSTRAPPPRSTRARTSALSLPSTPSATACSSTSIRRLPPSTRARMAGSAGPPSRPSRWAMCASCGRSCGPTLR